MANGVLTVEVERTGDGAVVRCHGKLMAGDDVLYSAVKRLIDRKSVV